MRPEPRSRLTSGPSRLGGRTALASWTVVATLAALAALATPAAAVETFSSGDIPPGGTFAFTFREEHPQGYSYHCHPHPSMQAMVHVNADADGQTTIHHVDIVEGADASAWGYSVEHLMVEVGDTVVWTNQGTMVHTVTEGGDHEGHGDGTHGTDDHGREGEGAPGPGAAAMALALVAMAAVLSLRRRA